MIPQFSTLTLLSTYLWADNWLLQRGQAYTNTSSRLYYQADSGLGPNFVAYTSPFRQWVWDSGVSGAIIGGTISGTLGTLSRGQSGMMVDYENGRVIFPAAVGKTAIISGSYAFKDLNLYKANESQERIVFTNKYYLNSRLGRPITGIAPAGNLVTPAIFLNSTHTQNKGWALGGTYNTEMTVGLVVLAETLNQLEGTLSLFTDAQDVVFPKLETSIWPLNAYGDFKSGYNYEAIKAQYGRPGNYYTVTDVRTSKVSDGARINDSLFCGLVDLTVSKPRSIH